MCCVCIMWIMGPLVMYKWEANEGVEAMLQMNDDFTFVFSFSLSLSCLFPSFPSFYYMVLHFHWTGYDVVLRRR